MGSLTSKATRDRDRLPVIDLLLIVALSVILAPVAYFDAGALRVALGVPFVLFFPGYGLVSALFPRKGALDGIERVALGFGLSIALVPLIGLVLNYTPWGIRSAPIHFALFGTVTGLAALAGIRRLRLPREERFEVHFGKWFWDLTAGWRTGGRWDKALTVVLIVAICGAIGATVYMVQRPIEGEKFTEFYILGPGGKAENYPRELLVGQEGRVIMGVVNREHEPMTYRAEVVIGDGEATEVASMELEYKEEWEEEITFTPTQAGEDQKVEFFLYRDGAAEPYADVHLWVDVRQTR